MEASDRPPLLSDPSSSTPLRHPLILPPKFEDAELPHLLELIADMIERLIAHNDQIPFNSDYLTRFHSRSPPGISVLDYLARIVRYANVDRSCLLITLHYIDQICTKHPRFTITSLTVHRFIIASVTVSSKALCDVFCTNAHYARVGGIRTNELNILEREFLSMIDWRLFCTAELLQSYYVNLVRSHSKKTFRLDIDDQSALYAAAAVARTVAMSNDAAGPSMLSQASEDLLVDEASTAHDPSTCSASGTVTDDDEGMRSDSDSGDDFDDVDSPVQQHPPLPSAHPTPLITITPRTAAKRRAENMEEMSLGEESLRPRGRRRLDGD